MSSPKELYTAFVKAINARDWQAAQAVLSPTTNVNGEDTPAEALVQKVAGLSMIGPDLVSTIDYLLPSPCGTKAFSRIIHRFTLTQDVMGAKATGAPVEFAEASFFFATEGKISKIYTILDFDGMRSGAAEVRKVAPTMTANAPAPAGFDLLASYKSYVDCVQRGPTVEELSKYCHERMIVNNQEIALEQFIATLNGAKATIEGMHWDLVEAIVDEEKQQIATRVILTGTPVAEFAGKAPNGKGVEFPEHVLYQLEGGKIKQMVQLMDLEVYRTSLG
jgi:predicted ester cyclase